MNDSLLGSADGLSSVALLHCPRENWPHLGFLCRPVAQDDPSEAASLLLQRKGEHPGKDRHFTPGLTPGSEDALWLHSHRILSGKIVLAAEVGVRMR